MRVAFFLNEFPAVSQTFVLNQVKGVMDFGHEVDIYAMRREESRRLHPIVEAYRLLARAVFLRQTPDNRLSRLVAVSRQFVERRYWNRSEIVLKALNIRRYGREAAGLKLLYAALQVRGSGYYDVVHCQFGVLGRMALNLMETGALHGRLIVSIRGYDITKHIQDRPGFYDELFARAHLFLPVSVSLKQRLLDLGCPEEKIVVHHSGIECQRLPFRERRRADGAPVEIFSVGRLVEKKGFACAIEAVARILPRYPGIRFTIAGDGELRGRLQSLIERLGVGGNIRLIGEQSHEAVIAWLERAHLFLAPSVTAADGDQEGIPNAIKEAMACGLPVVSSTHSGIPELVEHGVSGLLAPERDVEQLAAHLQYLLDHPECWPQMGRAARRRVEEQFDAGKLNAELVALYEAVQNA